MQQKKNNIPFKVVYITSDMKGKTHHYARVHHHLVINHEARDIVMLCWKNGIVKFRALRDQVDYSPLAYYLLEQTREPEGKKLWTYTKSGKTDNHRS